jgi:hypothetical protein
MIQDAAISVYPPGRCSSITSALVAQPNARVGILLAARNAARGDDRMVGIDP